MKYIEVFEKMCKDERLKELYRDNAKFRYIIEMLKSVDDSDKLFLSSIQSLCEENEILTRECIRLRNLVSVKNLPLGK